LLTKTVKSVSREAERKEKTFSRIFKEDMERKEGRHMRYPASRSII
jgi:hypothetical protein